MPLVSRFEKVSEREGTLMRRIEKVCELIGYLKDIKGGRTGRRRRIRSVKPLDVRC